LEEYDVFLQQWYGREGFALKCAVGKQMWLIEPQNDPNRLTMDQGALSGSAFNKNKALA
jgi:hypothetical protein